MKAHLIEQDEAFYSECWEQNNEPHGPYHVINTSDKMSSEADVSERSRNPSKDHKLTESEDKVRV